MKFKFRSPVIFRSPIVIEPSYMSNVKKALREGQKLLATKLYLEGKRQIDKDKNIGLREAKDYVFEVLVPKYYKEPNKSNLDNLPDKENGMSSY